MSMTFDDARTWVNGHSGIATLAALVLMVASVGVMANSMLRGPQIQPRPAHFYNLDDGTLFVAQGRLIPPIAVPGAAANAKELRGVRAYVYSCTSCADEESHFIGWLEMYTPQAKALLESPADFPDDPDAALAQMMQIEEGQLMRGENDRHWVNAHTDRAMQLIAKVQERCGSTAAQPCLPKR